MVRGTLLQSVLWFEGDVVSSGNKEAMQVCREIGEPVRKAWSTMVYEALIQKYKIDWQPVVAKMNFAINRFPSEILL